MIVSAIRLQKAILVILLQYVFHSMGRILNTKYNLFIFFGRILFIARYTVYDLEDASSDLKHSSSLLSRFLDSYIVLWRILVMICNIILILETLASQNRLFI